MSLTLTVGDVSAVEHVIGTLTAPFDYPDVATWGAAVMHECRALLSADQVYCGVPDNGRILLQWMGDRAGEAFAAYERHYWSLDSGFTEHRRRLGLDVYSDHLLYEGSGLPRTASFRTFYHEWLSPNRLLDAIGMAFDVMDGPLPAGINLYHDSESGEQFGERGVSLLRILAPAFKAGVVSCMRAANYRSSLAEYLDRLSDGAAVFDLAGTLLHQSPGLALTLAGEPERERVGDALEHAVRAVILGRRRASKSGSEVTDAAPWQLVNTARGTYRVAATFVPAGALASVDTVLVTLRHAAPPPPTDAELRARFRLTPREVAVARALALGMRNAELAAHLGIREHTAWNHTERVLRKLGVRTRAAVAYAIDHADRGEKRHQK